jgi:ferric-dicitrate binding protein FerR (iron transport regulator)
MIIEVRPASPWRRHRARIAGAVACVAMVVATLYSVAQLSSASETGPQRAPYSDPAQP